MLACSAALLGGCFRSGTPNLLLDRPTLIQGKTYRYRIPIGGCASPIVVVNGRNWEPDTRWPFPYPKTWKVQTEGPEAYLVGTVRLASNGLVIALSDGTIVNEYHPTAHLPGLCA